ncbi:2-succinyl-5-enolpyruvyl-6-hydroxy-3-cyclohexene-1-carboxylate synthase [Aeromonas diversa CDC 2478-85]|uniref:2-succinyl-5-enolpyruvyl-6-hydroxy-3-cyclohexene-1-carboxylate synthase n=1 Tax=Aeromonas diversa CDC 2478-85 TaxID=1268237 RepID=N9VMK6_9GAMM|nr:2-succinyl-5-enolpyruvyl-6-hydroxy-3-cyclohexene-1-carboxylic-acid synthase [Aeromonas diversa]ENY72596.1 2-succinyl-5-enolpyruvyl-6-hydroxy-3-cyclohexene-1-carboxylate synthase [Aeromonas diversa CDC 2478-85]
MFAPCHATFNHVWAALLLEELYRLGVRDVALAPGSRSTPLTMAAATHPGLRTHLHFDERGLGFFALGLAKGSARPVAVITTSGTAVANLWPAVAEAQLTGAPLVILSADRPVELIDNGANQAIDQQGIFARYPVYQLNLPSPCATITPAFVLSAVDQAIATQRRTPGVVHLNCMYPEPLYPDGAERDYGSYLAPLGEWLSSETPWSPWQQSASRTDTQPDWDRFAGKRGVVIAGRIEDPAEASAVAALAKRLGWPLIADLQSQLRFHPQSLLHTDLALHDPHFRAELGRAQVLLQFGARLISKRLGHFVRDHAWQDYWLIDPKPARLDPDYRVRRRLHGTPSDFVASHPLAAPCPRWDTLDAPLTRAATLIEEACAHFSELGVCHQINRLIEGQLFVGNSMPARLMDMLGTPGRGPQRVMTNRGASGIDGLIATACGFAESVDGPTTLLIGDLSALHDLNSLALLTKRTAPLVVILLNNDGGSIFNMLPVPTEAGLRDTYYRLPHGLDFAHAAAMFGLTYRAPDSLAGFEQEYRAALQAGVTIIEIKVPSDQVSEDLKALGSRLRG